MTTPRGHFDRTLLRPAVAGSAHRLSNASTTSDAGAHLSLGNLETSYRKVPVPLLLLFLAFIVFRYVEGGERIQLLGQIRFELLMGAVLSVIGLVMFFQDKKRPANPPLVWATLLAFWMLVMVGVSESPAYSWTIFFDRVLKFMMITVFIVAFVTTPTTLTWFIGAYLLAFAKMAQEGIHGLVTGSLVWQNQGVDRLHGPTWSYVHPNSFSGTQLGTLPFIYHFFPFASKFLKLILLAQAICALVIILYCGSRTAYLGFFVWMGILVYTSRSRGKAITILAILGLAAIPFIPEQYIGRFETVFTQQDIEGQSIDTRKQILSDAFEIFLEHPLGVGVGAFPHVRAATFGRTQDTHNLYLEVATNLGVIGLVLFLGLIISMLRTLRLLVRKLGEQIDSLGSLPHDAAVERQRRDLFLMRAAAQATSSFLIIRLALGLLGHDLYEVYWWFALGITAALLRMEVIAHAKTEALKGLAAR